MSKLFRLSKMQAILIRIHLITIPDFNAFYDSTHYVMGTVHELGKRTLSHTRRQEVVHLELREESLPNEISVILRGERRGFQAVVKECW